jgi:hypothetical protein
MHSQTSISQIELIPELGFLLQQNQVIRRFAHEIQDKRLSEEA